jgi:acetylornithine deacetylase/succinyl-diaminopimelate desuccinylase family protein
MIEKELLELIKTIVEIESVNGNEENLGNFLYDFAKRNGLGFDKQYCTPNRFNVLISYPPVSSDSNFGLLFHAHFDTVPKLDMEDPFHVVIMDGMMKGRGTVDQKSGLASALYALLQLKKENVKLEKPVVLACVIDEESEHRGSMKLVESNIKSDYAIVTEPTNLSIVLGCKGTLPIKITVGGKASHGCRPWLGTNALQQAMPIIQKLFDAEFEKVDFGPNCGVLHDSINLGVIKAGSAYNNVPDKCEISLDCRIIPGESTSVMIGRIKKILEECKEKNPTLIADYSIDRPDWNWKPIKERGLLPSSIDEKEEIVLSIIEIHKKLNNCIPNMYITDGYTDMDFLINDLHIPSIVYGPGVPSLCHTADEQIELEQVNKAYIAYKEIILSLCK